MATTRPDAVDELQSRRPDVIQWWLSGEHGLPPPYYSMEERMIHRYFSESSFFDWTTKNGLLIEQARFNIQTHHLVHDRRAFEAELRKRPGVEYVIAGEPQNGNGIWVIRKQERLSEPRNTYDAQNPFPSTETLGTWYIVGENVYQAPSVGAVLGNRMLSASTSLTKFLERARKLPSYAPTTGHTYLPLLTSKTTTANGSAAGSPARSREGSVAPAADSQSLRSGSIVPETAHTTSSSTTAQDSRLLAQSLQMSFQFADEYADENPIVGEPGSFKFTSSAAYLKKRKADEEAATALAAAKAKANAEGGSKGGTPKPNRAPSPPAVFTEAKAGGGKADREKREEKKRRRKSRPVNAQTPGKDVGAVGAE